MNQSTRHKLLVALAAFLISQACAAAALSTRQAAKIGERCWSDVRTLSDDAMEGRRAGTPGHRRAAEFVAAQFNQAKLQPGGEGGYFQAVQLESRQIVEQNASLALVGPVGKVPLELGKDAILLLRGAYAE